jgi:TolA-binding protein
MADMEKQLHELKKEIVEARNLVIKNDNLLKNLHADLKKVLDKQESFERRSWWTGAAAYFVFATLASTGAYLFATAKVKATTDELAAAHIARDKAEASEAQIKATQEASDQASKKALHVFERLAGDDEAQRSQALTDLSKLETKKLTTMEQRALEDKSRTLRAEAAKDALDSGKAALNRRDWRTADADLTKYMSLVTKVEDQAYLMVGTARHGLRNYKDAIEPLRTFLKNVPASKQGDYATVLLGEALTESGDLKGAVEVYRNGGNRYYTSSYGEVMRTRARRIEKQLKDTQKPANSAAPQ